MNTVSSSPITNHLTSFIPSFRVSETTLEIRRADLLPILFVYLNLAVSSEMRISGSLSFWASWEESGSSSSSSLSRREVRVSLVKKREVSKLETAEMLED